VRQVFVVVEVTVRPRLRLDPSHRLFSIHAPHSWESQGPFSYKVTCEHETGTKPSQNCDIRQAARSIDSRLQKYLPGKENFMRQQILFDIAVIVVPIALILIPETVELIVRRYFIAKKPRH
jgi:hypothetical protein